MKSAKILSIPFLVLILFSCDKIKRKGHDVVDRTKENITEKKDAAIDKLIPSFDSNKPDTKNNRKRFEEFFGFAPTADVHDIFCFDDQIGIDSKFLFSFKCGDATKDKIVRNLNLKEAYAPDNFSTGLWQKFSWWDSAKIVKLNPYWSKSEHEVYRYFWFDNEKLKAYYIEFDM